MDVEQHEECIERVIKAHQRVVAVWRMNKSEELEELESITEKHTQDALYRPLVFTEDVEEEFYEHVDERIELLRESPPPWSSTSELVSRLPDG